MVTLCGISKNDHEARENILHQLFENSPLKSGNTDMHWETGGSESPFEEEVFHRLAQRIGRDRLVQQYKVGGFRIDLVVKSKISGSPYLAIECDGAKYHSSNEAYAWDLFRQEQLEQHGYVFHRIWSKNWWSNSTKELNSLVQFVENCDKRDNGRSPVDPWKSQINTRVAVVPKLETEKKKITPSSIVTLKSSEGKTLKVKFRKTEASYNKMQADTAGIVSIYEKSPLAISIIGHSVGDTCQLGMLEVYYEILNVE